MLLSLLLGTNLLSLVLAHGSLVNPLPRFSRKTKTKTETPEEKTKTEGNPKTTSLQALKIATDCLTDILWSK